MHKITKKQNQVLDDAIAIFGKEYQIVVATEELSELTKELCKYQRYKLSKGKGKKPKFSRAKILDELADVFITMREIEMLFDDGKTLQERIDYKIARLDERIKAYEPPVGFQVSVDEEHFDKYLNTNLPTFTSRG